MIQPATFCLFHATTWSFVNGCALSTAINSGSSLTFINDDTVNALWFHVEPYKTNVALASCNLKGEVLGRCVVDIVTQNETYQQVGVGILKDLCIDLLLKGDFQSQHNRAVFQYYGSKADLFVPNISHLNVKSKFETKPVSFFSNLLSDCYPVAAKSRHFNAADQKFIAQEVNRLHSASIICPSVLPWRP